MNISDLRQQPAFRDHVADRIWRNWWKERGTPLAALQDWVGESLSPGAMPFALVAYDGDVFAGLEAAAADHFSGQTQNLDGLAHVEDEDFAHQRAVDSNRPRQEPIRSLK